MNGKNMDLLQGKLADRLREASRTTFYGLVKSVDEKMRTCKVQIGEIDYEDVLLYASVSPDLKGFVFIPAVNSLVLVSRVAGTDRFFVALFSEIDKIVFTGEKKLRIGINKDIISTEVDKSLFKMTASGFTLKNNSTGLKKSLNDLLTAIQQLTVPTPNGPSGVPANAAQFEKIRQELSMYLEE